MNILITILFVIAGLIALIFILALFMRKNYYVQSEIVINAPTQKVFEYLRQTKNQDEFNKWRANAVAGDPNMKREFKGTDGTVGFIYKWDGNKKAGAGENEIKSIVEGKSIETEIRFIRPFTVVANTKMLTEPISDNQTKVISSISSTLKYPLNVMVPMVEKNMPKDIYESLQTLKNILEK